MERIISATPLPSYRLRLRFTDGAEGDVDLSHLVGRGVFEAWRDETLFRNVSVDPLTRTVTWPGGLDLCPDVLYHQVTGKPLPGQAGLASAG
jgi:hypothetical protein